MSTSLATFLKDPNAVLDYGFDWHLWLAEGETLTESTWILESDWDLEEDDASDHQNDHDETTTVIWLRGGVGGTEYKVTNHIVTSEGREDDRTLTIKMKER